MGIAELEPSGLLVKSSISLFLLGSSNFQAILAQLVLSSLSLPGLTVSVKTFLGFLAGGQVSWSESATLCTR